VILRDIGEEGQEDELARRRAGGDDAHHQPLAFGEPAIDDGGAQHEGRDAGAEPDAQAPGQNELPGRGHERAGADAGRDQDQRLLAVANDLFYRHGIRSVGIDQVIAEANVAKMSLYRSFASKDELAAAYLKERHKLYWQW